MDKIFKIGLLVPGFGYLAYLFCPVTNQVGRYKLSSIDGSIAVFDTTNSKIHFNMSGLELRYLIMNKNLDWEEVIPTTIKK